MTKEKVKVFMEAVRRLRNSIPDELALENITFFPDWKSGIELQIGEKVVYDETLYRVTMNHFSSEELIPNKSKKYFTTVEVFPQGTINNPIKAIQGMNYELDKYYLDEEDNNIYKCIKEDVLHYLPHDLVGAYFVLIKDGKEVN